MKLASARIAVAIALVAALVACAGPAATPATPAPLAALPQLDLARYSGAWYQVALYPNRFQRQCVSDTTATYRGLPDGSVEVVNRCTAGAGQQTQAIGAARPVGQLRGGVLAPAQLQVTFLPTWLRWLDGAWGSYWVIQLADDYRYAVVCEPSREYLWVLSRRPALSAVDEAQIHARLQEQGFDLARLQPHSHAQGRIPAAASSPRQ